MPSGHGSGSMQDNTESASGSSSTGPELVNAVCAKGKLTALHAAVSNGDVELARLLIADHGADVYARDKSGISVVRLMLAKGNEAVALVAPPGSLDHGTCSESVCNTGSANRRTLSTNLFSGDAIILRGLLDGPNVGCLDLNQSWYSYTAIHKALRNERDPTSVANILLDTGRVDCDLTEPAGNLSLHYACAQGLVGIVAQILARTTFSNTKNNDGRMPFELLLQCLANDNDESRARRAQLTFYMLESGRVDLSKFDDGSSGSIVHFACQVSTREVLLAVLPYTRHLGIWNGNPNLSPFQAAVDRGDLSVIAALLEDKKQHQPDTDANPWTARERDYLRLTELIGKRDLFLLTDPSAATPPFSLLHFGAFHLDQAIIQQVISLESGGKGNPALFKWTPPSFSPHFVSYQSSRLPIFMAMFVFQNLAQGSVTEVQLEGLRSNFLAVFDALVSSAELFQFRFSDLEWDSNVWVEGVLLTNTCCDVEMVTRMAQAGFSLPWKLLRWDSDKNIRIALDRISQGSTLKVDTALAVVCSGRCPFVGILKTNFDFAEGLPKSGLITPGSLSLDGDELRILGALGALLPTFSGASVDLLRELIRLGFNSRSALLQAAEAGLSRR